MRLETISRKDAYNQAFLLCSSRNPFFIRALNATHPLPKLRLYYNIGSQFREPPFFRFQSCVSFAHRLSYLKSP
jgi:hypothetical protein